MQRDKADGIVTCIAVLTLFAITVSVLMFFGFRHAFQVFDITDSHNEQICYCEERIEELQAEIDDLNDWIDGMLEEMEELSGNQAVGESVETKRELIPLGRFETTGYCQCSVCCGKWSGLGKTASGAKAEPGVTVAADWSVIPKGTRIYIEGVGERIVQDKGGAVKGNVIDIMYDTHEEALNHGRQTANVYLIKED